jgi:hypothetical protein
VNNAAQTNTNPDASKITVPVDGTSIPTGGTFDFLEIKDSNKNKIGFISFPPRRSGSVPVLMIYPRKENITNDETFKLGREEVIGKFSGIRMANKFLSWTNPQGQTADKNWIPDVTKVIGNLSKSPLESWFSKWCIVFANEPDTDFNQLTNQITEHLDSRAMTISSLNLTIFADSGYIDNSIMASLSESQPFPIKTLMLLEIYPSMEILKISKRIKSEGGQVYNVYDSQNFKTNITKNIIAGLSYSGSPFEETSIVSGSTTQSQLSNPILFFDSVTGATISATQYNTFFKTSASSYSPFPLIPYSSLPLTLIPGSSPSQFTQSTSVKFLNDLAFTYTTLAQDLLKEGVYVYDLSKDPVQNFTPIGLSAGWPEVKLINGNYILTTPTVAPEPVVAGSTASVSIPDINVKYVLSHLQQTNIDELPQLGFQIFYSDIEKIIGQSTQAGSASQPKVLLSGQFTFDVRRKGYFINDQLGEFKIIDKQEIDLFIRSNEEVYEEGPSPEFLEEAFVGEEEEFIAQLNSIDDEPTGPSFDESEGVFIWNTPEVVNPVAGEVDKSPVGKGPIVGSKLTNKAGTSMTNLAGHRLTNIPIDLQSYLRKNGYPGAKIGNNGVMRDLPGSAYPGYPEKYNPDRAYASLHGFGLAIDLKFDIPGFVWEGYKKGNPNLVKDPKLTKTIYNFVKGQGDITWGASWANSDPANGIVKGRGITEYHHFEIKADLIPKYWEPLKTELAKFGFKPTDLKSPGKGTNLHKLMIKLLGGDSFKLPFRETYPK